MKSEAVKICELKYGAIEGSVRRKDVDPDGPEYTTYTAAINSRFWEDVTKTALALGYKSKSDFIVNAFCNYYLQLKGDISAPIVLNPTEENFKKAVKSMEDAEGAIKSITEIQDRQSKMEKQLESIATKIDTFIMLVGQKALSSGQ